MQSATVFFGLAALVAAANAVAIGGGLGLAQASINSQSTLINHGARAVLLGNSGWGSGLGVVAPIGLGGLGVGNLGLAGIGGLGLGVRGLGVGGINVGGLGLGVGLGGVGLGGVGIGGLAGIGGLGWGR